MPTPRKSPLDRIIGAYKAMTPEDRAIVVPVLRGIERFTSAKPASEEAQQTFEELGARAAEEES